MGIEKPLQFRSGNRGVLMKKKYMIPHIGLVSCLE